MTQAHAIDPRQLALVSAEEAPVVPPQRPQRMAKVITVQAIEVRTWGREEERAARAAFREMLRRAGIEYTAEKMGLPIEEVDAIRKGGTLGARRGEALLAFDVTALPDRPLTREQRRSRRPDEPRARTVNVKRMSKREIELGRMMYPEVEENQKLRPKTRADCEGGVRPCPWVGCRYNNYLSVNDRGSIKLHFSDLEPWEVPPESSCVLDMAQREGMTLEEVGKANRITRERVRQLEVGAMAKVLAAEESESLREHADLGATPKRRLPVLRTTTAREEEAADGNW